MDNVTAPVQKKPFPLAAVGFILCLPVLWTRAFLPMILRFLDLSYTVTPVELITLFITSAALICLVIGLFLRKTNMLVSVPLCVMSGVYAVQAFNTVISWIKQITFFRDNDILNVNVMVSNGIAFLLMIAAHLLAFIGFLLYALMAFRANKNNASLARLWWIPFVSFIVSAFFSVVRAVSSLASLEQLFSSLSFDHAGQTLAMYSRIYNFVFLALTATLTVLFAISGFFLGKYLKKSV